MSNWPRTLPAHARVTWAYGLLSVALVVALVAFAARA